MSETEQHAQREKIFVMGCVWGLLIGAIALLGTIVWFFSRGPDPQAVRDAANRDTATHRAGEHCVVGGFDADFVTKVKDRLRDPASFEHIETHISPVDATGRHLIVMRFRSRNGFGGMNEGTAVGAVSTDDCTATVTVIS